MAGVALLSYSQAHNRTTEGGSTRVDRFTRATRVGQLETRGCHESKTKEANLLHATAQKRTSETKTNLLHAAAQTKMPNASSPARLGAFRNQKRIHQGTA